MKQVYALAIALTAALTVPAAAQGTYGGTGGATAQRDTATHRGTRTATGKKKHHKRKHGTKKHTATSGGEVDLTRGGTIDRDSMPRGMNAVGSTINSVPAPVVNSTSSVTAGTSTRVHPDTGMRVMSSTAATVDVKVDRAVASTARVTADSAFVLARRAANRGEVSSAELEEKDGRLVYEVKLLNPHKKASTVWIDARTGETLEATAHGGLKATYIHHKENKKLLDAKRDSAAKNP